MNRATLKRRNSQLVVDKGRGDCFRASLTSLLGIPNDPALLPDAGDKEMHLNTLRFLWTVGLDLRYEINACWGSGLWVASVPSLNFEGSTHAIVMSGTEVEHDPSPHIARPRGESLIGRGLVLGGWIAEVVDASLLPRLVELQARP